MSLAIFDLDNTLLSGDSDFLWGVYLSEIGVVDGAAYEAKNQHFYEQYKRGELDIMEFLAFSLRPLAENEPQDLLRWRAAFVEQKIRPLVGQPALDLVKQHHAAGDTLLVITATNTFVTRPIVDLFGIEHLIGTEPEQISGRYTGQVAGIPSFRDGKVIRLQQWLEQTGESLLGASFYSDSHNDLPLLQQVDRPVAVDPDDQLRTHAANAGWPILSLHGNHHADAPTSTH